MSAQLTDRELLEFAAKACGWVYSWLHNGYNQTSSLRVCYSSNPVSGSLFDSMDWNPLTDDGDAFRLAVKLGIRFDSRFMMEVGDIEGCMQVAAVWLPHDFGEPSFHGFGGESAESIIRGLVVRAAAEIGKAMP